MEKELWDNAQALVNEGSGHLVKHLYIEELTNRLTPEQMEKLGDISATIDRKMASGANMEQFIEYLVHLSRKGVIIGPKNNP